MEIIMSPLSGGRLSARLPDGRAITTRGAVLYAAARALLADGVDPSAPIHTRHEGSSTISMRSTVGEAALWMVTEGERDGLRRVPYRPPPQGISREGGRVAAWTAKSGRGAGTVAEGDSRASEATTLRELETVGAD